MNLHFGYFMLGTALGLVVPTWAFITIMVAGVLGLYYLGAAHNHWSALADRFGCWYQTKAMLTFRGQIPLDAEAYTFRPSLMSHALGYSHYYLGWGDPADCERCEAWIRKECF